MAKYTIELRKVCDLYGRDTVESWFKEWNLEDYLTQDEIDVINERGTFNKDRLARMIVNNYYMREIGLETPALFHLAVTNKMFKIMEKYSYEIYSASIQFDPLVNVDFEEVYNREINDTGLSNSSGLSVNSNTPQGQINKNQILQGKYASQTSASEGESNTSSQSLETSSKRTKGNSGVSATAQALIKQYRDIIITINTNIINDLNDLFMGLY
ncbi:MAG: hypothetical protein IKF36_01495 [Bacilli bacterium]|nr:hypothetical protein [Bacilli bacterium]